MNDKEYLPVAEDISQWNGGIEILYKCPHCPTTFRILGIKQIKYCFNCGTKISHKVLSHVTKEISEIYHNHNTSQAERLAILQSINDVNEVI